MARKRFVFLPHLQSILKLAGLQKIGGLRMRVLSCFMAAMFLSVNLPAVWAQTPIQAQLSPTELVNQAQVQYDSGNYEQSADFLHQAITAFKNPEDNLKRAIALGNLSLTYQALRDWDNAQSTIENSLSILEFNTETLDYPSNLKEQKLRILAPVLDTYGQLWQKIGDPTKSLKIWQQSTAIYVQLSQNQGWFNSQINQLQALQALGLYQQAANLADNLTESFQALPDSPTKAKGLRSFGEALRNIGELSESQKQLKKSLDVVQTLDIDNRQKNKELSAIFLSLGNTSKALGDREKERQISINRQGVLPWQCIPLNKSLPKQALQDYDEAERFYLQAENTSTDTITRVSTRLNRLSIRLGRNIVTPETEALWKTINQELGDVPASRSTIYAQINLAKQGACLKQLTDVETLDWDTITNLLKTAAQNAQQLDDIPAESYALGNLGGLYEFFSLLERSKPSRTKTVSKSDSDVWETAAITLTEQALVLAQPSKYPDIAYQWQWQLGRLKRVQGSKENAIALYEQSVETLELVRGNLLTIDSDVQFSFRDNVEPIYRELVDLLLTRSTDPSQDELREVVDLIDNLQLAELENFLRCRLPEAKLTEKAVDPNAAIFYPIILRDRLEVILSLPGESSDKQRLYRKPISNSSTSQDFQTTFEANIKALQDILTRARKINRIKILSSEIYSLLIEPFETELEAALSLEESKIHTLVFASDGVLRNLPMPTLYDAKRDRYLVERYAVAIAPSVKLLEPEPLARNAKILVAGFNQKQKHPFEPDKSFSELSFVEDELKAIELLFPTEQLFNKTFNEANLNEKLEETSFPIVHLATHGEFSSDPERTFILTSKTPINAKGIDRLLRNRGGTKNTEVKLLVLSACKTATGDNRAVLGLAGITVRAGSSSTMATLWSVDDESAAQLMTKFYTELQTHPNITKTEALRRAQTQLLENKQWEAPRHWAPYILVGNWL